MQGKALIEKNEVGAPEVTGREIAEWDKGGHRSGKVQGEIQNAKVLTGTKQDSFLVKIHLLLQGLPQSTSIAGKIM